jgi:hypothetical protein
MRNRLLLPLLLVAASALPAPAMQVRELTLYSPVNGQPFPALGVPKDMDGQATLSDLGSDDDGCRHSSGMSEYEYTVVTDPHSFFTAQTLEWDEAGRFRFTLTPEFRTWVDREFVADRKILTDQSFKKAQDLARTTGQPAPDARTYLLSQQEIPLEKRFQLALICSERRNMLPGALAKLALNGAWALRVRMNVPIVHSTLEGGWQELQAKVQAKGVRQEVFDLNHWYNVYTSIFRDASLTDEGYMAGGLAAFGLALRVGDPAAAKDALDRLEQRFPKVEQASNAIILFRGIVRERRRIAEQYTKFLDAAADGFLRAIDSEEYPRRELPTIMHAVAECMRRTGRDARAWDWYLALTRLAESQPKLRADIRAAGKAPAREAPLAVLLAWQAEARLADMRARKVNPGEDIGGPDRLLINAILNEGLGTAAYRNDSWKPATGAGLAAVEALLDEVGKSALNYEFRRGAWPVTLDEMWENGAIRDRNRLNRFHDPATGTRLLWQVPQQPMESVARNTVLVATAKPIDSPQGPVYGGFLAGLLKVVWSSQPMTPGTVHQR